MCRIVFFIGVTKRGRCCSFSLKGSMLPSAAASCTKRDPYIHAFILEHNYQNSDPNYLEPKFVSHKMSHIQKYKKIKKKTHILWITVPSNWINIRAFIEFHSIKF